MLLNIPLNERTNKFSCEILWFSSKDVMKATLVGASQAGSEGQSSSVWNGEVGEITGA